MSPSLPFLMPFRPGPVVGRVESITPIPAATAVRRAMVDVGTSRLQIVFGGPDVVPEGSLVPVAPPGHVARCPWPAPGPVAGTPRPAYRAVTMRARRYRGVLSQGMLCSIVELGWADDGPDEVPVLCTGTAGQALPQPGDPIRWLCDESLERLMMHEPARAAAAPVGQTAAP